jgi:hypothetical protein
MPIFFEDSERASGIFVKSPVANKNLDTQQSKDIPLTLFSNGVNTILET